MTDSVGGEVGATCALRRATALVCRFEDDDLVIENYLSGRVTVVHPSLLPALRSLTDPVALPEVLDRFGGPAARSVVDQLVDQEVLVVVGNGPERRDRAVDVGWPWGVPARYFHYSTRRTVFGYDLQRERDDLVARARAVPQPPAFKDYGRVDCALPPARPLSADLGQVLANRRTGRSFSSRPLGLPDLATVLRTTWGITDLRTDPGVGVIAFKTSPSGGARHPIETYCVARNVDGLDAGVYHYCAGRHTLTRLPDRADVDADLLAALTQQPWVTHAAAVFIMTAVIGRSGWKYPQAHAYRVVLLDAGHLGQTFHLACTALGLSPWTSAAIDETAAEKLLDLHDPGEVVLYASACGWPDS